MSIQTINPATGEILHTYETLSLPAVEKIITQAHTAFSQWRSLPIKKRADYMQAVARILLEEKEKFARLISLEMGKPFAMAVTEIEKCARACVHFADHAADYLQSQIIKTDMTKTEVVYQPTGIIFAIMPWNFPFWQVFRFAAPNLMAGNVAILKHAPVVTGCGLAIEKLFHQAGFPAHVFSTIVIDDQHAEQVIKHSYVTGVTLTGSQRAGSIVAAQAGNALKKVVLELGGNDPYLILEDADLKQAAKLCVASRMNNSGQICIAVKRAIVVESVYDAFMREVLAIIPNYRVGDPLEPSTQLGPLARADLRDKVAQQVETSIAKGAKLLVGGNVLSGKGFYYEPTVLGDVKPGMPAFDEEIFGPVLALIKARDEAHAVELANQSIFGLGAGVFTCDIARGEKIAKYDLEAGTCVVNSIVTSDPRVPFGGAKLSGFGRELAAEGMHEFMNIKTVHIK